MVKLRVIFYFKTKSLESLNKESNRTSLGFWRRFIQEAYSILKSKGGKSREFSSLGGPESR